MYDHVFYTHTPQTTIALDYAVQDADGHWRSLFGDLSAEEIQQDYPGARVASEAEFRRIEAQHACTEPEEIAAQRFHDALGAMPPRNLTRIPGSTSFMLTEMHLESIAKIFVVFREADGAMRYFMFRDRATLTHRQILNRVTAVAGGVDHA